MRGLEVHVNSDSSGKWTIEFFVEVEEVYVILSSRSVERVRPPVACEPQSQRGPQEDGGATSNVVSSKDVMRKVTVASASQQHKPPGEVRSAGNDGATSSSYQRPSGGKLGNDGASSSKSSCAAATSSRQTKTTGVSASQQQKPPGGVRPAGNDGATSSSHQAPSSCGELGYDGASSSKSSYVAATSPKYSPVVGEAVKGGATPCSQPSTVRRKVATVSLVVDGASSSRSAGGQVVAGSGEGGKPQQTANLIGRRMEVPCLIKEIHCKALWDTGAQVSLVDKAWLENNLCTGAYEIIPVSELVDQTLVVEGVGSQIPYLGYIVLPLCLGHVERGETIEVPGGTAQDKTMKMKKKTLPTLENQWKTEETRKSPMIAQHHMGKSKKTKRKTS